MNATPQGDRIDASEPLPGAGEPWAGRWASPYLARSTGLWTVNVLRPLTPRQVAAGLVASISASTLAALEDGMARQDAVAAELSGRPGPPSSRGE